MADFAVWGTAAAPALGWTDDHLINVYFKNRQAGHELALDASPVGAALRALTERAEWIGTATELLNQLNAMVDEASRRARTWPTTGRALAGALRRLAPNLRAIGIEVTFGERQPRTGRRLLRLRKTGDSTATIAATVTARENTGFRCDDGDGGPLLVARPVTIAGSRKCTSNLAGDDGDVEEHPRSSRPAATAAPSEPWEEL